MTTPHQTEPTVNNALADLLRPMMPGCQVRSEQTGLIVGHPGQHPDVLVTSVGRSPVVIEAEYMPAVEAELDASQRMGIGIVGEVRSVEAVIALRYPSSLAEAYNLHNELATARLSYCVLYADDPRFPTSGWLEGSLTDLADLIRLVSVPHHGVDTAADILQQGIDTASDVLTQLVQTRPDINPAIARRLNMVDVPQMRRIACSIIANAMLFHERLAGRHGIKPLQQIFDTGTPNRQAEVLDAWQEILKINYLDIFQVARGIISELPAQEGTRILNIISLQVLQIAASGVNNDHDLTGQVFQRLIADRKYLATFYTLPASAALLAGLAVAKMDGVDWTDLHAIANLRIADFACGTGALLSAVAEQITSRYERTGGDVATLHTALLEQVLYGFDVMPSAIHITGSTLAGLHPSVAFEKTNLKAMPYGRQADGTVAIGSLELLDDSVAWAQEVSDTKFDLVIMNPPFTSNSTNERIQKDKFAPAFAAFDFTTADQRAMTKRLTQLKIGTCYHGHAGMASAFAALGHRVLNQGGVLALVLPLTAAASPSWRPFRRMMETHYENLSVLSMASFGRGMSFSSDTDISECLVIGRKRLSPYAHEENPISAQFVSFRNRPVTAAEANALTAIVGSPPSVRHIEDGPFGGTPVLIGNVSVGEQLSVDLPCADDVWGALRTEDHSIAQVASGLSGSRLWLPGLPTGSAIPMTQIRDLGRSGLYNLTIVGKPPQGPFDKAAPSPTATYPALWNHSAKNERRLICQPDSQLLVREGMESKAAAVWLHAGRAHINQEFTFGSQPLAAAFTVRDTIGGRVWPNVNFSDDRFDVPFILWSNCTLGLVCYWWHSSRQQSSKATIAVRETDSLSVFDFRTLTDSQLTTAETIFDEFSELDLQPAYLADADPNRAFLDRRVVCDLLGFDEDIYHALRLLSAKWCAEPSVHGGKARPRSAKFVA